MRMFHRCWFLWLWVIGSTPVWAQTPAWKPKPATNGTPIEAVATRIVKQGMDPGRVGDGGTGYYYHRYRIDRATNGLWVARTSSKEKTHYHDFDVDGDGDVTNDVVTCHRFDLTATNSLSPWSPFYDLSAGSQRFYGGAIFFRSDMSAAAFYEDGMNGNEEGGAYQPRRNWTFFAQPYSIYHPMRCYYIAVWQKADFLNGGANYAVSFNAQSELRHWLQRYFMGIEGLRWVVRNGTQFYVSEEAYRGMKIHTCRPLETRWALYNPQGPHDVVFEPVGADFQYRTFDDVTSVGFYLFQHTLRAEELGFKWYAYEADAVVHRPQRPSENMDMVKRNGQGSVPSFYLSTCEVPYALWRMVHRAGRSNYVCGPWRGCNFDASGDMGSMDVPVSGTQYGRHSEEEPVTDVTYHDALAWCNALSMREGRIPCYYEDAAFSNVFREVVKSPLYKNRDLPTIYVRWNADGYRLPTPSEWALAWGNQTVNTNTAWIGVNSTGTTHAVGIKSADPSGVYDLIGNVWELTWPYGDSLTTDQLTDLTVLGGDFRYPADPLASSASAYGDRPFFGSSMIGLRLVRRDAGLAAPPSGSDVPGGVPKWTVSKNGLTAADPGRQLSVPLGYRYAELVGIPGTNYAMGKFELTFAQWKPVYDWAVANGYGFDYKGEMGSMAYWGFGEDWVAGDHGPNEPVTGISACDAVTWCNALSQLEGRTPVYYADAGYTQWITNSFLYRPLQLTIEEGSDAANAGILTGSPSSQMPWPKAYARPDANGYRLPSYAEYEHAARAGNTNQYFWGSNLASITNTAWLAENSGFHTHDIGAKTPNAWGLYDTVGNAMELSWDPTWASKGYALRWGASYQSITDNILREEDHMQSLGLPYPDLGLRILAQSYSANQAPIASNQTLYATANQPAAITLTGSDADSDLLTFATHTGPAHGALSGFHPGTGAITYTPRHAYIGDDAFTFYVSDSFATSATATVTIHLAITDADGDALADDWETAYFGNPAACLPNADSDGDGFTNQQEYQANTNPKDAKSLLKILDVTPIGAGYRVSFATRSNVFYRVEQCDDLAATNCWTLIADNVPGTGGVVEIDDPTAGAIPRRFYRVKLLSP